MNVKVLGTGKYLPPRVLENEALEDRLAVPRGWIEKRTGIVRRHVLEPSQASVNLALPAARQALEAAGIRASDVDVIICASAVPEQSIPATSCFLQAALGASGSMCFDINATCFSFPVALWQASLLIQSGQARHVLVCSAECSSLALDDTHPESACLFGDGAAAAVVAPAGPGDKSRMLRMKVKTLSEGRHLAQLKAGGSRYPPQQHDYTGPVGKFRMDGKAIFKMAARHGEGFLDDFFAATLPQEEWRLAIPHQTSVHGVSNYSRKLGFRTDQVFTNLRDHGNCVAASIPMALHDAVASGKVRRGDPILLLGTAAGLSLGAVGLVW